MFLKKIKFHSVGKATVVKRKASEMRQNYRRLSDGYNCFFFKKYKFILGINCSWVSASIPALDLSTQMDSYASEPPPGPRSYILKIAFRKISFFHWRAGMACLFFILLQRRCVAGQNIAAIYLMKPPTFFTLC